jgi:fucose permease
MPVVFMAGFLADHLGRQAVLVAGCVLIAVSLGTLALARAYPLALAAVVLLSSGWALLIIPGNVLIPHAFALDKEHAAYAYNLANVFFGLGAFCTPLVVAVLLRRTSLPPTIALLGCFALVPTLLSVGVDFAPMEAGKGGSPLEGLGSLLTNPVLWLCGLTMFFYGPLEASLAAWATTYLGERGVPEGTASRLLSGFWLAFLASRLVTAFTLPRGLEAVLILALALACVGVMLGLVLSRRRAAAMGLVLAAGLIFGPIFPTNMAILLGSVEESMKGRAVGLLFAIGGIGWTMIPILIGAYARRTSVQRGFSVAVGAALGLSVVALLLVLWSQAMAAPVFE